jgi:hypothetical protein
MNYNFRTQTAGASAQYYIDNIMLIKLKPPVPSSGTNFTQVNNKIFIIDRFKKVRRGGQKRSDFF